MRCKITPEKFVILETDRPCKENYTRGLCCESLDLNRFSCHLAELELQKYCQHKTVKSLGQWFKSLFKVVPTTELGCLENWSFKLNKRQIWSFFFFFFYKYEVGGRKLCASVRERERERERGKGEGIG